MFPVLLAATALGVPVDTASSEELGAGTVSRKATVLEISEPGTGFAIAVAGAGDVNGDGYKDVLIGGLNEADENGNAWLFYGSPQGVQTNAAWRVTGPHPGSLFGIHVASVGDVNGDGYDDIGVGASRFRRTHDRQGAAFIYYGNTNGPSLEPSWTVEGQYEAAFVGGATCAVGDVNGDGFGDVAVAGNNYGVVTSSAGFVLVFHGSNKGLGTSPAWEARGTQRGGNFSIISSALDVNRDGFADLIVGEPNYSGDFAHEGQIHLYCGSTNGLSAQPVWTTAYRPLGEPLVQNSYQLFGNSVGTAGDVNADNWPDLVVGAYYATNGELHEGKVLVYHGSPTGFPNLPSWTIELNQPRAHLGHSVSLAGDVNGDGFSDIIFGAPEAGRNSLSEGLAAVVYGSKNGLSSEPSWTLDGTHPQARMGQSVSGLGDVNGDGFDDVVIAESGYRREGSSLAGRALVYYGSSTGLPDSSNWRFSKSWLASTRDNLNAVLTRKGLHFAGGALLSLGVLTGIVLRLRRSRADLLKKARSIEQERARIARDLHDGLGSELARIASLAVAAESAPEGKPGDTKESLAASARLAMRVVNEVVWSVKPSQDNLDALLGFLTDFADQYFLDSHIELQQQTPLEAPDVVVTSLERLNLLFIVKEAFANILKHSGANKVTFVVNIDNGFLTLCIHDNGRGIATPWRSSTEDSEADGISNMHARAREIGARLNIDGSSNGTTIRLILPLSSAHRPA